MEIKQALAQLDHNDDAHWTEDGLPRVDVVAGLTGDKGLKRSDITNAAPDLVRGSKKAEASQDDTQPSGSAGASPPPDGWDPLEVESNLPPELTEEELLQATPRDFGSDLEMMERWLEAANNKCLQLNRDMNKAKDELKVWSERINIIDRVMNRIRRAKNIRPDQDAIQSFLKRQHEARAERAERAQEFLRASTSARAVLEQVATGSKLDKALQQRKPAPGSTRPDPRLPVQRSSINP